MMLCDVLRDAVEYSGPRQYTEHSNHLAEVTRLPHTGRAK